MSEQTRILGIHTSTPTLGLAQLDYPSDQLVQDFWYLDRQLSSQLHCKLSAFCQPQDWSKLAAIAVAVGPGSFTSCRLGVTLARTLGYTLSIPVFGFSTLAAVAHAALTDRNRQHENTISGPLAVQLDARRGDWYGGIFSLVDNKLTAISQVQLWSPDDWATQCTECPTVNADEWNTHPPVATLVQMAAQRYADGDRPDWSKVVPLYGRKPPIHTG